MIWSVFEYIATIAEYLIYADFMVRFLTPKKKERTILCYLLIIGVNSALTMTFNHFMSFEGIWAALRICINFVMAIILLKGSVFEKIFVSLIVDICALLISFFIVTLFGLIFNQTSEEIIVNRGLLRLIILFTGRVLQFTATRWLLRIKGNNKYSFSFIECFVISIVFIVTMLIGLGIFQIDLDNNISSETPITILIGVGLIAINILVYILMKIIGKKNIEKSEFIID